MPVVKLCSKHRTLSAGRCPRCADDRRAYTAAHVNQQGKDFRLSILARDGYRCYWCGEPASTVDYIVALALSGQAHDPSNAVAACKSCNSRRGAAVSESGNVG